MNGMASSTPFSVKKDSKENSAIVQGISSTNNDASAIKRVRKLFLSLINIYFLYSYTMMQNVKLMN
jgi:hypothetical protein